MLDLSGLLKTLQPGDDKRPKIVGINYVGTTAMRLQNFKNQA